MRCQKQDKNVITKSKIAKKKTSNLNKKKDSEVTCSLDIGVPNLVNGPFQHQT